MARTLQTKRIYDAKAPDDGLRILVDRIWPRGLTKAEAAVDLWLKDVAPSTDLRKWFAHRTDRWDEFRCRYLSELRAIQAADKLRALVEAGPVTLLYAARDRQHNHALVLAAFLQAT